MMARMYHIKCTAPAIIIVMLLFTAMSYGQAHSPSLEWKQVLRDNTIGKEFHFAGPTFVPGVGHDTLFLRYLGTLRSRKGKVYKIVNSIYLWPVAELMRGTGRILVFDSSNRYLGQYYLTTVMDVPDTIINNRLVFRNTKKKWGNCIECDPRMTTRISFDHGLPRSLFRKWKGKWGDFYKFGTE